jgi:hypothetical protein
VTRRVRLITHNGITLSLSDWARRLGITRMGLWNRLRQVGTGAMTLTDALRDRDGRKLVRTRKRVVWVRTPDGQILTIPQAAKIYGCSVGAIRSWIKTGHLTTYRETPGHCSFCKAPGHYSSVCPQRHLAASASRAEPASPPSASGLAVFAEQQEGAVAPKTVGRKPPRLR